MLLLKIKRPSTLGYLIYWLVLVDIAKYSQRKVVRVMLPVQRVHKNTANYTY